MLEDYKKAVITAYHKKKEEGELSSNLTHPTAAKLRQECLIALRSRTKKQDEKIIRDFFNLGIESNDYEPSIKRFDRDKLKPLDNFIKGETEVRDDKNVEVLAWLLNFEPRPYNPKFDYNAITTLIRSEIERPEDHTEESNEAPSPPIEPEKKKSVLNKPVITKARAAILFLIVLTGGIYLSVANSDTVYICEHGTGKKYHLSAKCPSLKNCKNGIIKTTIADAEKNGKTLCGFEPQ